MPTELPPPRLAVVIEEPRPTGAGTTPLVLLQAAQPPLRIPETDIVVEVVGELPLRVQLEDMTRLLGRRQMTRSVNRTYPPTILELITLVEPNPAKPPGRAWTSINALTIGYDPRTKEVVMEYCLDHCTIDQQTGASHARRKMVAYRAPEGRVMSRLQKKLGGLKKYAKPQPVGPR